MEIQHHSLSPMSSEMTGNQTPEIVIQEFRNHKSLENHGILLPRCGIILWEVCAHEWEYGHPDVTA